MNISSKKRKQTSLAVDGGSLPPLRQGEPSTAGAELNRPPLVIRGANKKHQVGVGVDWFKACSSCKDVAGVKERLESLFGPAKQGKGIHFYDASWRFANGAMILFDIDGDKGHCVDLPGGALTEFEPDDAVALCRELLWGRKCRRIDACIDFQTGEGERVGLIDAMIGECRAERHCGFKRWKPVEEYGAGNHLAAYGVNLGQRGKNGSGRYVRAYDKGLETGTMILGQWERLEAELSDDVASKAALHILLADDWQQAVLEVVLGCFDFREKNGSTALSRRPRVQWWADLLDGIEPVRVRPDRPVSSLEKYSGWLRRSVLPTLKAMANLRGVDVSQVMAEMGIESVLMPSDAKQRPAVWQYLEAFAGWRFRQVHAEG